MFTVSVPVIRQKACITTIIVFLTVDFLMLKTFVNNFNLCIFIYIFVKLIVINFNLLPKDISIKCIIPFSFQISRETSREES